MKRLIVLLTVLATLCSIAPAHAHAARKKCSRAGAAHSSFATLYFRDHRDFNRELVACVKSTRRRTVLASWYEQGSQTDDPAPQYWLTGRFVAINQAACPGDPFSDEPCTGTLKVIDLRTRRRHATVTTGDPIFGLFLTRRGSVALLHRGQVITADGADVQVLDEGAENWSLAYAPLLERVYWTSAGAPHSATLR
jgi:hypothetical protein